MPVVLVQKWEESERGWGTRPNGYSLHLTELGRTAYIKAYWDGMPDHVPAEYSRPDGKPYQAEVGDAVFVEIKQSQNGTRYYNQPPGSGGLDGWIPFKQSLAT